MDNTEIVYDPRRYWRFIGVYALFLFGGFLAGSVLAFALGSVLPGRLWPWPVVAALPLLLIAFPAAAIFGLRQGYAICSAPNRVIDGPGSRRRNYLWFVIYALAILGAAVFILEKGAA